MKFCPNCGKELKEGATFCANCGTKVGEKGGVNVNVNVNNNLNNAQRKSKVVAGILGILLGSLGIHNFYLGYTGKAVAQLLISLLSCGTLAVVSSIWGLIEGIMILTGSINTDANGNPLND